MLESVCWEMNGGVSLRLCKAHSGGIWRDLQGMAPWMLPGVGRVVVFAGNPIVGNPSWHVRFPQLQKPVGVAEQSW